MTTEDKKLILAKQKMMLLQKPVPKVKLTGIQKYKMHQSLTKRRSNVYSNLHWLLDTSGSMAGDKIWQLIDTVQYLLPKYPNVKLYQFESIVRAIPEDRVPHLVAGGMTHMMEALQVAWQNNADGIVLVTDGDPTDAAKGRILDEAKNHYSHIPIHTIGIGEDYEKDFLQALSDATNGNLAECGTDELSLLTDKFEEVLQIEDRNGKGNKGGAIQLQLSRGRDGGHNRHRLSSLFTTIARGDRR